MKQHKHDFTKYLTLVFCFGLILPLSSCKKINDAMNKANQEAAEKELKELKDATPIGTFAEKDFRKTVRKEGLNRAVEKYEGYVAIASGEVRKFKELMTPVGRAMYVEFNKRYKIKCTFDVGSSDKIAAWAKGQTRRFRILMHHVTKRYVQGKCTLD